MKSIADRKAELRERFRAYRDALTETQYADLSRMIVASAQGLPEIRQSMVVHVYWPLVDRHEVDTRPLIRWLEENGMTVVLPRILSFRNEAEQARLAHVRYPGERALQVNRWGIAEPPPGEEVSTSNIDLVVVPAFGAGRDGHRIGHGFGYYDEFLSGLRVTTVALVYGACLVDEVPHEPHDVPVDVVVTEHSVVRIQAL